MRACQDSVRGPTDLSGHSMQSSEPIVISSPAHVCWKRRKLVTCECTEPASKVHWRVRSWCFMYVVGSYGCPYSLLNYWISLAAVIQPPTPSLSPSPLNLPLRFSWRIQTEKRVGFPRLLEEGDADKGTGARRSRVVAEMKALEYVSRRSAEAAGRRKRSRDGVPLRSAGSEGEVQAIEMPRSRSVYLWIVLVCVCNRSSSRQLLSSLCVVLFRLVSFRLVSFRLVFVFVSITLNRPFLHVAEQGSLPVRV